MRTPKIEALHRLINWFNLKNNDSVPLLNLDTSPLSNSSWLSGILDADGSFYLNWKLNKKALPIGLVYYLRISQKQTYSRKLDPSLSVSNILFMEKIAEFLKTKIKIIERDKGFYVEKAFEIRTEKLESKIQLFNYLSKYPLFSYKYLAQINLAKIHNLNLNKEHKTTEGRKKLEEYSSLIKYDINKKYTWEHLNRFYKD